MKEIIIFGSGDHAKVVLTEILKLKNYKFVGFCDEIKEKNKTICILKNKKFKTIGSIKEINEILKNKKFYGSQVLPVISEKKIVQQTKDKNLYGKRLFQKMQY